jgi:hypothetical protein
MRLQFCHLLLLCLAASLSGQSLDNTHSVLYGDRADLTALPVTSRVFLDRNGDLYPELPLSDSLLAESDASLAKLFIQRPDVFHTTQSSFAAYQDSVLAANLKVINEEAREVTDVIVLVHGFRKPFHPKPGGRTSRIEYLHLQQRIRNTAGGGSRPYFVEVYWDGTYDCCFGLKAKRNRDIFELFEQQAQSHATVTGYRLRPLLAGIQTPRLHLIGHSLGTRVILAATFDAYAEEVDPELRGLATPGQGFVDICLVGPAVAGGAFEQYHHRGGLSLASEENYRTSVFYNRRDFVLRKRVLIFGPGPRRFGDTSLGADRRRSIRKLTKLFETKFPGSPLFTHRTRIGVSHALRDYGNTPEFSTYLRRMWN